MPKTATPKPKEPRLGRNAENSVTEHGYVVENGKATYVQVPVGEYEQLVKASAIRTAGERLDNTPENAWIDADAFRLQLAGERIAEARRRAGLTQQQLAAKLKVPQSQISRIERNPDHTTVRTLKKVARALKVDVAVLI